LRNLKIAALFAVKLTNNFCKPMSDPDITLAKKKLARDLKILVGVQVVALCALGLDVPILWLAERNGWNMIGEFCSLFPLFAASTFFVAALTGCLILGTRIPHQPIVINAYVLGFFGLGFLAGFPFLPFVRYLPFDPFIVNTLPATIILPFYSIIGQFFIARWLENEPQGGTMESPRAGDEGTP
jgi:hypothetical protein